MVLGVYILFNGNSIAVVVYLHEATLNCLSVTVSTNGKWWQFGSGPMYGLCVFSDLVLMGMPPKGNNVIYSDIKCLNNVLIAK